jgi:hypothetical protein
MLKHFYYFFICICFTTNSCKSQFHNLPANYTEGYIKEHKGTFTVEVPEVQELVHIAIALTPKGINDSDMVEHSTKYYKDVLKYFSSFQNHTLITSINKLVSKSIGRYAKLKMSSCNYYFSNDRIVKDTIIENIGWDNNNYIADLIDKLEDFAKQSNFRDFYKTHQSYYDSLIAEQKKLVPLEKQWLWLESNFPATYDSYRITFSALTNGSHSTARFEGNGFKEMIMFICPPFCNEKLSQKVNEALVSKIVFTEIDHNYVNPITEKFKKEVSEIFSNRNFWTNGKNSNDYNSAYAVFNEYMTFGVYLLYCYNNYTQVDFEIIKQKTEYQVSNLRGFSQFKIFNEALLQIYKNRKSNEKIVDLFPAILEFCRKQS